MIDRILRALGALDLLDRLTKLLPDGKILEHGERWRTRLEERFAAAAREEFRSWVDGDLKERDPFATARFRALELERHEWQASGGRFNRLSEEYMNEALGRIFTQIKDPERRFTQFGEIARYDDREFEAWLDAVTNDGFQRYILFVVDTVMERVWPRLTEAERTARNALRWAMGGAIAFYLVFVLGEVTGNNAVHGLLFLGLLAGVAVAWWHGATVAVAVSTIQRTRSAMEVVAAGFATATLMLVVGILVPFHLAPRELELASIITMPGLAFVAYWGFLKGMQSPLFSPKTIGFVFASVLLVTAFWSFNEKYDGAITDSIRPVYSLARDTVGDALSSPVQAEALEVSRSAECLPPDSATLIPVAKDGRVDVAEQFRYAWIVPELGRQAKVIMPNGTTTVVSFGGCQPLPKNPERHFWVLSEDGQPQEIKVAVAVTK